MPRARLPPLNAIKAFEAAARLGSFTRAAEELSFTHGAVSRQIRLLEEWLGTSLFLRTSRNAVPTRAGTDLLAEAGPALDRLAGGPPQGPRSAPHISTSDFRDALADPTPAPTPAGTSRAGNADRHREHAGRTVRYG